MRPSLTAKQLRELLEYAPETGAFYFPEKLGRNLVKRRLIQSLTTYYE